MAETVATLVAAEGQELALPLIEEAAMRFDEGRIQWLKPGKAADIFTPTPPDEARALLTAALAGKGVDILVQAAAMRCKALLLADMESTIIKEEMLDELAGMIGQRDLVANITRRAMNGELDFAAALRERVALLKDQPASILEEAAKRITMMPGAADLVKGMKSRGGQCWLISGGFTCFAEIVARKLGFDTFFANELLVREGKIVGTVTEPILDRNTKKSLLERACRELNIAPADCLAVGDGANDIPMLQACNAGNGLGVAYHAKPRVQETVANQINHADLSALLYAQGLT